MSAPSPSPTLARHSFWVPPARRSEFESIYETRLVPILEKHGLVTSPEQGRPTVEGVFSRLFAIESPAAVAEKGKALQEDAGYQEVVQALRQAFALDPQWQAIQERLASPIAEREYLSGRLDLYSTPAGPGKQTMAGPGKQRAAGRGSGFWRTFDATDGLPGGIIRAILQDPEGALWIGSHGGGLSRFDGEQFKTFTARDGLASRMVQSIVLAQDGALWIGTHGQGIYRYDGQRFEHFTAAQGLVHDYVLRLFQDREGNLWVGTWRGLSRWDGHTFSSFTTQDGLPADEIHAIFQDREGYLWFGAGALAGGSAGGACRYDGNHFTSFTAADGLAAKNGVWSIFQDREGSLWFGTAGGVSRYDHRGFTPFTTADGLGANEVWAILQDREGALWFGTKYGGVSRYDGQHFTTLTTEDGLGSNSLEVIFEDREGSLWFGTWNGLSRYEAQSFTTFTARDGLPDDQVLSACQDREGALWFGTAEGGVCRYDGRTFTAFAEEDGLPDNRVSLIFQDREGLLWFTSTTQNSGKGVCRYDGFTFTSFTTEDGLADDRVYTIFQDREGALWFGASRYDGHTFASSPLADGLPSSMWISYSMWISAITQDQEEVFWFSTQGRGVIRYDGQESTTFTTQDGLADNAVHAMIQDRQGVHWFGTHGGGLSRYDGQWFKTFTAQDGLADNVVHAMTQDSQGRIWIGTPSGGVSCYDGQVFQTLTAEDGLADNRVAAILQDREGNLWFSTNRGVTRYRSPPPSPPPLFLDAVVADRRYGGVAEVEIPDSVKVTAFEFHSISLKTRPEAMVYRYRLEGYEEDWQNTHARRVEYQNLPLGVYTFRIQAVDRDLNYSKVATVRLEVVPDPRDTRIDELEQRVQERTRELEIARDAAESANRAKSLFLANISHEIRTPMNAILGYAQILERNADLPATVHRAVETILKSGDHLLKLINDVLDLAKIEAGRMSVRVADFDLKNLMETLAVMFEIRCREKGLQWRLEGVDACSLSVRGDEGRLNQVLTNLLSNAVKFTQEGEVVLRVAFQTEDCCYFEVSDTGMGIATEEIEKVFQPFQQGQTDMQAGGTGLGLAIARRQVDLLGGQLEVESHLGEGSRFFFTVPLPAAKGVVRAGAVEPYGRVLRLARGCRVRALVADDVAENRDLLCSMLVDIGVEVAVAEDGQQALDLMEKARPDIAFVDIRMPVLDGLGVLDRVRQKQEWRGMKVVSISASVLEHERREYLAAGFDAFIPKPFRFAEICACLAELLGVEYEYAEPAARPIVEDWAAVVLPADLLVHLRRAAELYSVTEMEDYLKEMERLGEGPQRLAVHLRELRRRHDMSGILTLLGETRHSQ